jgi:hypothetical protein
VFAPSLLRSTTTDMNSILANTGVGNQVLEHLIANFKYFFVCAA